MKQNSLDAYYEIKDKLTKKQMEILAYFSDGQDRTNKMLAKETSLTINRITPRTGELRDMGYLVKDRDEVHEGRKQSVYRVTEKGVNKIKELKLEKPKKEIVDPLLFYESLRDDYAIGLGWDSWEQLIRRKAELGQIGQIMGLEEEVIKTYNEHFKI